jgi:pyruvate dehydrogenase E2 component (dihydrolipoamide acetyltransferase)
MPRVVGEQTLEPATGRVVAVHAAPGDLVPIGMALIEIGESSSDAEIENIESVGLSPIYTASSAPPPPMPLAPPVELKAPGSIPPPSSRRAMPFVRKLAMELGVDIDSMPPTVGVVTEQHVREASMPPKRISVAPPARPVTGYPPALTSRPPSIDPGLEPDAPRVRERRPMRGVRRAISAHLARAQLVPAVTVLDELDLTTLDRARAASGLGYLPFVIRALVSVFREVPGANAVFDETKQELVLFDRDAHSSKM